MCKENKWIIEQFKCLEDERNAFDRYLWQVPVAALGVTALMLRAVFSNGIEDNIICLGAFLSFIFYPLSNQEYATLVSFN